MRLASGRGVHGGTGRGYPSTFYGVDESVNGLRKSLMGSPLSDINIIKLHSAVYGVKERINDLRKSSLSYTTLKNITILKHLYLKIKKQALKYFIVCKHYLIH